MENKVLVKLIVPELNKEYDIFLPINKKIGNIIILLNKTLNEFSNGTYPISNTNSLYNIDTKKKYDIDVQLYNTDIRNGTRLMIIS
jgi:hypothetical protein